MFKFHEKRADFEERLGAGSFGEVFPYRRDLEDKKWVVKCIVAKNVDTLISSIQEVVLGFACDHPCVVPVKGYFIQKIGMTKTFHLFLKIPRMKESLFENFQGRKTINKPFTQEEIIKHFYSLVCGLRYLHSKKIYHGDIRHENLLLDEPGCLKIGDVGIAKHVEDKDSYQTIMGQKGTYGYSAPEVMGEKAKKDTLPKADIWSLGVVILELCLFEYRLLHRITLLSEAELQARIEGLLGRPLTRYPGALKSLVRRMLSLNPKERPSLDVIKSELEKNFSQILAKNLLDQDIGKISEGFETERRQLQETITQLKSDLYKFLKRVEILEYSKDQERVKSEKKIQALREQIWEMAKELNELKGSHQKPLQAIQRKDEQLKNFERQIKDLKQQKMSSEQKIKDLKKYIQSKIGNYEHQIKILQESLQKARLEPENYRTDASFGECFDDGDSVKLYQVISQLDEKWREIFQVYAEGDILFLRAGEFYEGSIMTEDVISLSKELILTLKENNLNNLFGLDIYFNGCLTLKDEALIHLAGLISSQPLGHLTLNLNNAHGITKAGLEKFIIAIEPSLRNISQPELFFNPSILPDFEKESVNNKFANMTELGFIFKSSFASTP